MGISNGQTVNRLRSEHFWKIWARTRLCTHPGKLFRSIYHVSSRCVMQRFLPTMTLFVLLSGCNAAKPTPAAAPPRASFGTFGIDTAQMDSSVKPGDDFYKYVNGKWLSTFRIPADKASYGVFDALVDRSESDVHALLDELGKTQPAPGSVQKKVVDFYNSWMDQPAIETRKRRAAQSRFRSNPQCEQQGRHHQANGKLRLLGPGRLLHLP